MAPTHDPAKSADPLPSGTTQVVDVHFEDLDPTGVLHNSRYLLLVERAVTGFWLSQGWHYDSARSAFAESMQVVRTQTITYHQPIVEPGRIAVHFWVDRIGNTSYTYGYQIRSLDRTALYAEGSRVQVNLDSTTLMPTPITGGVKEIAVRLIGDPVGRTARAA
ncbi:acyl-CoA thioesterase [Streptomyces sp. CWNU-52B]|uniref:acyl-CoA thioesterase n=1 Tax=unclassified Streptomyces TaxID=2593676 RepID=UPI0039C08F44